MPFDSIIFIYCMYSIDFYYFEHIIVVTPQSCKTLHYNSVLPFSSVFSVFFDVGGTFYIKVESRIELRYNFRRIYIVT